MTVSSRALIGSYLHRLVMFVTLLCFTISTSLTPAMAQSVGDVFGQVMKGVNVKAMATGWLTDKLTQALTKSSGAMPGDKRLADGGRGLALTRDEQQHANEAAALFNEVEASAPEKSAPADVLGQSAVRDRVLLQNFNRVAAKYGKLTTLSAMQQGEVEQALQPFILQYLVERGQQAGLGAVVVPARAVESYTFGGYCSDPHLPAPKSGEQFQLVPTSTLYPDSLRPALQGLLRIGAQSGHGHDGAIQGLIWTIRKVANGEALGKTLTLSNEQQQLLARADPNALANLQSYYVKAQGQRLMQDAIRSGVGKLSNSLGGNQNFSPIGHSQALSEVANLTRQLESAPVSGSVQGQNAAYTLLNGNVAALATTTSGGLSTVNVDLANRRNRATVFYPGSCVAQATRPAQRLAMQMIGGQNATAMMNRRPEQPARLQLWQGERFAGQPYIRAQFAPLLYHGDSGESRGFDNSPAHYAPYLHRAQFQIIEGGLIAGRAVVSFCGARPQICRQIGIAVEDSAASLLAPRAQSLNNQLETSTVFCSVSGKTERPQQSITVYRLYGGASTQMGKSWTDVDPRTMKNPRSLLGLPNSNKADRLVIGELINQDGVYRHPALPLDGHPGGGPELEVPLPKAQITVTSDERFYEYLSR